MSQPKPFESPYTTPFENLSTMDRQPETLYAEIARLRAINSGLVNDFNVMLRESGRQQDRAESALTELANAKAVLVKLRGDIHHGVDPVIGFLRLAEVGRLPEGWNWKASIARLMAVEDAADVALGERPLRDQLAELQKQIHNGPSAGNIGKASPAPQAEKENTPAADLGGL